MSESHEYYTFSVPNMIPEGRRVFSLMLAVQASHELQTGDEILQKAKLFDEWLKESAAPEKRTKPEVVK